MKALPLLGKEGLRVVAGRPRHPPPLLPLRRGVIFKPGKEWLNDVWLESFAVGNWV